MEVHHHPNVEKKTFKEYFLEFLMIFLAVAMGFFAENIRENVSDSRKVHQYSKSMIRDIKSDADECDSDLLWMGRQVHVYDTMLSLLDADKPSLNKLYYFVVKTFQYFGYKGTYLTIDQLKSTGGLRLFENDQAADSMNFYYENSRGAEDYMNTYMKSFYYYHEDAFYLFQYSLIAGAKFYSREELLNPALKLKLLNNDYQLRQRVYNKLFALRAITLEYIDDIENLKGDALECIKFLKREFGINEQ
jgi:hypothetical protein